MYRWLVMLTMICLASADASPRYIVGEDESWGGDAEEYLARIEKFRASKIMVMLPKECMSSCTLYILLLKDGLVCTRHHDAQLVFHQFLRVEPRTIDSSGEVTSFYLNPPTPEDIRKTWWAYPPIVRRLMPDGLPEWGNELAIPAKKLGIPNC